eukprot:2307927-Pyramimonas_sp.AAC.1
MVLNSAYRGLMTTHAAYEATVLLHRQAYLSRQPPRAHGMIEMESNYAATHRIRLNKGLTTTRSPSSRLLTVGASTKRPKIAKNG